MEKSPRFYRRLSSFFVFLLLLLAQAPAQRTLKFWAVTGSVLDVEMYRSIARDFERANNVHVEVTPIAWGNFQMKYFTAMAAGLPPDIGVTNLGGPFDYGTVGGLVDLLADFPEEAKELEKQFDPKLLEMFGVGGKLYGIPCDLSTLVTYYRTDIFKKLGLRAPQTWSELNKTIGTLEANGYQYYFGFTNGAQWAIGLYTMPYGLPGLQRKPDGTLTVNWENPKYQEAVMEALRLWHMHNSPGKDLGSRVVGMFRSDNPGEAIPLMLELHTNFSGIHHDVPELDGKWDIAPWPKADDGRPYNVMGGTSYVIFRKSKMKREAMAWMRYLLSNPVQEKMVLMHLQRSTDLGMPLPSPKSMWSNEAESFWNQPSLASSRKLFDVLRSVYPSFATVEPIHGSTEANRLESNLLDQMGTYILDHLDGLARQKGMSRSELIRAFGAGKFTDEHAALEQDIAAQLKKGYGEIAPKALELLRSETARYQARYGDIIDRLPQLERQTNILDYVKWAAAAVLFGLTALVVGRPKYRKHAISYLFVATPLVLAIVFVFVPAVVALFLSMTDYHPVLPLSTAAWVGTENYKTIVHSGDLTASFGRTIVYALFSMPVGIVISLVCAYLLNYKLKGQRFWRFLYFSPLVTSVVSIALIFGQLFLGGPQGWLNALLMKLHLVKDPIQFLTSEHYFLDCVIILAIWQGLAFTILVFLAGLQQVPDALYEAAEIDGAGTSRRFWHIALPGIRPQLFFVTVLGLIGSFQVFEVIYTLAGKSGDAGARFGPNDSALTVVPLIFHTAFETYEMGKSAAIAYVLFAVILLLTAAQAFFYRRAEARS
ncbi:extracellular solute-binding protein [Fimbriimonas ginsengisoli]|uniref:Binding-protein-dependent transport systems inner membrane component n=1 Tax=Fimbriimonas ginsengisoli Gsoil 348 TaxID=661478 RepID=A0A068NRJ9_FIMGI|nr:extracellular solute-binding protein [Fimbriimonas ginsengisoli]AIE86158.1 binding-protein-dependent transport systems inner membrane component [Fimbriimonas ginsengisoli Gsoil 348]